MGFIDKLSPEEQVDMIMETLRSEDKGMSQTRELIDIYLTQDIEKIYQYTITSDMSSPEFEEEFLVKRNKAWIKPIRKLIKKNKSFIGVGAAHLGGPDGVIQLLKNEGYTFTPVKL